MRSRYSSHAVLDTTTMNIEENLSGFAIEAIIGSLAQCIAILRVTRHCFQKNRVLAYQLKRVMRPEVGYREANPRRAMESLLQVD